MQFSQRSNTSSPIVIDGSRKSGSGTIVRYAVAISALLKRSIRVTNVRARRKKPGLRPQHVHTIRAIAEITGGSTEGVDIGSDEFLFEPGHTIKSGKYTWDIGTAGSTTMLSMTILPVALFAPDPLSWKVTGGLFQDFAPSFFHLQNVLFKILHKMGIKVTISLDRPGYVPAGEGILSASVVPLRSPIEPIQIIEQGKITSIHGIAFSSHLKNRQVSSRMAGECVAILAQKGYRSHIKEVYDTTAHHAGAVLAVFAETDTGCILGADRAGALGRPSEKIGRYVARQLLEDISSGATVDRHCADQLILFAALAKGKTSYRIPKMTEHVEANLSVVEELLGATVEVKDTILSIDGIGFMNGST